MPVKELTNLAAVIVIGIAATHPMTFALELRKIELKILREASDTRSWGNPDIWHYVPPHDMGERARRHGAK
jgi:hypothetical protein